MTTIPHSLRPASRNWRAAQGAGVAITLALLSALLLRPAEALHVLWDMVIPLLPAVFLVNPMLWRNVCPLATLNAFTGARGKMRALGARPTRAAWAAGIVLLVTMVPARRFLFNTNGAALAITIGIVALLAFGGGMLVARRGGFCNALCPVLPVEKLYGQAPLIEIGNPRCADCSLCTPVGCIDLASVKTVAQTVGPTRRSQAWVLTAFGAFAAAFPGFIVGYFSVANGGLSSAAAVYVHVLGFALASYAIVWSMVVMANLSAKTMLPALGGLAFLLYYWLGAPSLASAFGAPEVGPTVVRLTAVTLLAIWAWHGPIRALRSAPNEQSVPPRPARRVP